VPDRPLVHRRTAVAGALGGLVALAGGCDTGEDIPSPDGSTSPSPSQTPSAQSGPTPDEALVDEVLVELGAALGVAAGARRVPQLRRSVTPLVKAHRAHISVLDGEPPDTGAAVAADLPGLLRSERRLHAHLVEAAGRAESGALAKLLASMSASVTQHLLVLPDERAR
jgi:hypothetical protein